ncbi:MAG TPA: thioredoxin [Clostridiales bacterium]|nr:MAG: thioredoxin [Clostridiales bacterium GWD2_32_59]HAN09172.1 thioredoxin [Clostridiales bacterium]
MTQHLTAETFNQEVINSSEPVLVDFYATWCGPCKMMASVIDELAEELKGEAKIFKVDIDKAQELARKYSIMSVPTFMIFKGGEVKDQVLGAVPKQQLADKIKNSL